MRGKFLFPRAAGERLKILQYNRFEGGVNPFGSDVEAFRVAIEEALEQSLPELTGFPPRLRESMRYSLLAGGKRLRPLLVLLAARSCGGDPSAALPAAVALEMIHCYSLIHDDLPAMDDDDLRRGRPTNHRQFDEATAILAGDGLLTRAFETLVCEIPNPVLAVACCRELARAAGIQGMVGGQQADLEAEKRHLIPTAAAGFQENALHSVNSTGTPLIDTAEPELQQLMSIHRRKTGALITCGVRMGAILAEAAPEQLDALSRYGDAIGLAFQITDDILDCVGTVETVGKGVGKDAGRDKLTYPGLLGLVPSQQQAERLIEQAVASLDIFDDRAAALRRLAEAILHRDR